MHSSNTRRIAVGTLALVLLAAPAIAGAQGKGTDDGKAKSGGGNKSTVLAKAQGIPRGHLPPPGQCRVWIAGTAPGQQAAPTDCRSAMEQAAGTQGARVVFGRGSGTRKGGAVTCENRRASYPTTAPLMRWASSAAAGTRSRELRRWNLPAGATTAINDFNGDGRPDTVSWLVNGQTVQIWHNPDSDGTADIVEIFCNGAEVQEFVY